jgi:uncharacterized protein
LALYYLETSALVKLYVRESGTEQLLSLARAVENQFAIFALAQVELRSAIRRREKSGEISAVIASNLLDTFNRHLEARFTVQKATDFVLDIACVLVDRYTLRAYDAIQLAGYVALKGSAGVDVPTFVCADQALISAATQEGMPVLKAF